MLRYANIKKASQDEQQNQTTTTTTTTTTTNINYIKNLLSVLKNKFNNAVNILSDETKTKQNNTRKDMNQSIKRFGNK